MGALRNHSLAEIVPDVWLDKSHVLFSAKFGDATQLWKVSIESNGWSVPDKPQQITSGAGIQCNASAAGPAQGARAVFSVLSATIDLWTLPLDPKSGNPAGELTRLTKDEAAEGTPDTKGDNNLVVFSSNRSGNPDIYAKDLRTGAEHAIVTGPQEEFAPILSVDGSKIAYFVRDLLAIYFAPMRPGGDQPLAPRQVCERAGSRTHGPRTGAGCCTRSNRITGAFRPPMSSPAQISPWPGAPMRISCTSVCHRTSGG